jgi:hypothetical protein
LVGFQVKSAFAIAHVLRHPRVGSREFMLREDWMKFVKAIVFSVLIFLLVGSLATLVSAQTTTTGAVAGTVLDPGGASVPDASVRLVSDATAETLTAQTDNSGFFTIPLIKPGNYTLTVEKQGFRKEQRSLAVVIGQNLGLNFKLEVGNLSEVVQVEAAPPLLQVENANLSTTFESLQVENLPNGGNDMTQVAQTAPGVLMNTSNGGGYGNFTAFGLPATANLFTINGNDANDPYLNLNNSGATNLMLGTNEVQEVAVVSNGYTVQYGRQAGAQVDYATKSGSNAFHGNASYWYNSGGMNANDFFNNASNTPLPKEVNNQWAASLGGPIKKDKIFFFVDQEGLRYILGTSNEVFLPTPQFAQAVVNNMQAGNSFVSSASVPFYQNIFNLYSHSPGVNRAVLVDNNKDTSGNLGCGDLNTDSYGGLTGKGTGAGAVIPGFAQFGGTGPNSAYGGNNNGGGTPCSEWFRSTVGQLSPEWILAAKVDVNFTDMDRVSLRYRMDRGVQATYTDPVSSVFNATSNQPEYDGQINWNHIFSSTKTNQLILSGLWYSAIFGRESTAAQATFPGAMYDFDTNSWANMGGENNVFPQGRNVSQVQIVDDFSWTKGNHTFKFGGNYRYNKIADHSNNVRVVPRLRIFSTTDFAEGQIDQISQRFPNLLSTSASITSWGLYAQDEWRVNANLKLQFGLRADRNTNGNCYQKCFSRLTGPFNLITHDNSIPYNQTFVNGLSHAFPDTQAVAWEPRLSFAWTPNTHYTKPGSTVLRGGVGLFSDLYPGTLIDNFMHNAMSLRQYTISFAGTPLSTAEPGNAYLSESTCDSIFNGIFNSGGNRAAYLAAAGAAGLPCSSPDYNSSGNKVQYPLYIEWNMELQQSVGSKGVLSFNYVGNHGVNEFAYNGWFNVAGPIQGLPAVRPDRRVNNVNQLTNDGISNYNGLTASYTQRATKGLTFTFNYTYSHTADMVSNGGILPYSLNDSTTFLVNPLCISCNYANSDYDVRHNISANYVWLLPFKFSNKMLETVAGGWQVSGTIFYRTGLPFSVTDNNVGQGGAVLLNALNTTFLANPTSNMVPRVCGDAAKNQTAATACFGPTTFQPSGTETTFSTLPRNYFRGPGYFNSDFSVLKNFRITEAMKFALGANFYNVLNHPNFANPVSDIANGQLGQITSTVVPPTSPYGAFVGSAVSGRAIQINARITF